MAAIPVIIDLHAHYVPLCDFLLNVKSLVEIMMLIWFVWCDQAANFWLFIEKQETQVQKYPITQ